jgi:hypothetical protein
MQLGFLDRTPRGRIGTERAFEYFGIAEKMRGSQQVLFANPPSGMSPTKVSSQGRFLTLDRMIS